MTAPPDVPSPHEDEDRAAHDRRYKIFALALAVVILSFAAISITVVITTAGG